MRMPPPGLRRKLTATAGAIALLCGLEAFRSMPYKDIVGVWTDGYGNTHGVVPGKPVTEPVARAKLIEHADVFGEKMMACLNRDPTQGQYDGFLLLTYNIGPGTPVGKAGFCPSTIVRRFNAGDEFGACMAMLRFDMAGGKRVWGLTKRRWVEYNLCIEGTFIVNPQPWRLRYDGSAGVV